MADRIFTYLDRSINELEQLKNEYTNIFQQHTVPWSNIVKIMFRAQLKLLQENMEYWDESITKLENKAKSMRNDDTEKQELLDKIDVHNNDARHRLLKREVSKILLEGQGYLELEQQQPNTTANITTPSIPPSLKISSLNIQKFNGDYLKWKTFWQRFEINVDNHSFSKVEKLDALIGLLEGIALDEVAGFEITEENYDTVVDTLKNRFGNSKLILKELHNNLRSIPPATTNAKSIRTTVNHISNMCRQLENYGVDIDNDSLQTEIIEKMPPREKNELIWYQLEKEETTTEMILEQMKKIALKAEIASNNFTKTSSIPPQTFSKTPTTYPQSFMKTSQNPNRIPLLQNNNEYKSSSKTFACSFCDDDHSSVRCPKFVTSDERIQQLKTKNCCAKCTKPDHNESHCKSNVVCRICQGHHYSFLCNQWNNTNYQKSNNSNTFISIEAQQGCLLTKKVGVSNPVTKETVDATILFDPGSQRSFISDRLIRQLKLPWEAKEKLELQGIGAKATSYVSTKVKLQIKTTKSSKDIVASSIPKIANSVSLVTFDENDLTKTTITETTPDILIGMDYFFTFINSFERKNDLVIVHSEVGQM
uniref:Peptidase A2 domain-containing protein n=1 Tax=Panagrolaimus sp. PS1159 TaxID=55785 RepID=A0AC35EVD8_9BILA